MKPKIVILTFILLYLIILSGCDGVETIKPENKTTIDYSTTSTTSKVNIVARKDNNNLNNTINQTNITI